MFKQVATTAMALVFAIALATGPADAGSKGRNVAIGIFAGIAAAAAITAAADAAQRHHDSEVYYYESGVSPQDNALAACLHKAHRRIVREGGEGLDVERIVKVRRKAYGYKVGAFVHTYGPWGTDRRYAYCEVHRDRIAEFRWE